MKEALKRLNEAIGGKITQFYKERGLVNDPDYSILWNRISDRIALRNYGFRSEMVHIL